MIEKLPTEVNDLLRFVELQIPESIHLDYKRSEALMNNTLEKIDL